MTLIKEHGRIQLPDFEYLLKTKQINWILKISHKPLNTWNSYGKTILETLDNEYGIPDLLLKCSDLKKLNLENVPLFYKTCLKSLAEILAKNKENTANKILIQQINGNSKLQYK